MPDTAASIISSGIWACAFIIVACIFAPILKSWVQSWIRLREKELKQQSDESQDSWR